MMIHAARARGFVQLGSSFVRWRDVTYHYTVRLALMMWSFLDRTFHVQGQKLAGAYLLVSKAVFKRPCSLPGIGRMLYDRKTNTSLDRY